MSEDKLRADAAKAVRAQQLLDNEILKEAFAQLEAAYIERWRTTHIDDDKGRERLFIAVNVVGKVKDHLSKIISDGKLASAELANLAAEAERRKQRSRPV